MAAVAAAEEEEEEEEVTMIATADAMTIAAVSLQPKTVFCFDALLSGSIGCFLSLLTAHFARCICFSGSRGGGGGGGGYEREAPRREEERRPRERSRRCRG